MKTLLFIFIISYFAFAFFMYLFQRSFIYVPQGATPNILAQEISFDVSDQTLRGWVLNPDKSDAVIYYGGNAETIEQNIPVFIRSLADFAVYLIPYRGYGKNPGKPTETLLYSDAMAIFDKVSEKHQRISIIGRSLGSGVATYMAVNRPIEKLILVTPYDSIENVAKEVYPFFPTKLLVKDKFLSNVRAPQITVPTLIVIAENDETISRARTNQLITYFNPHFLHQVLVHGVGHNDVLLHPDYAAAIENFFKQKA